MRAHGGIASPLLPGILLTLAAQAQEAAPVATSVASAEAKPPVLPKITRRCWTGRRSCGVGPFTAEQKKMMLDG